MKTSWNLGLLYKSHTDPAIEKDMKLIEKSYAAFEKKYRTKTDYLKNETKLFFALKDYEALFTTLPLSKPLSYFGYVQDLDANDAVARAKLTQLSERFAKNEHKIVFFELNLAQVSAPLQKKFLASKKLTQYRYFLKCIFEKGKYDLPEAEEKIMGLKAIPSYQMWVNATEKVRNKIVIEHEGERLPLSSAMQKIGDLPLESRRVLHEKVMKALEGISDMAESELNAIVTNKKINDELRGHKEPFNHTILSYQNDRKSVLALVNTVSKHFPISHRFYKLKAKLLKLPHLEYSDRNVGLAQNQKKIPFTEALATVRSVFGSLDKKYLDILDGYLERGQIDVFPKAGKTGGAYCSGNLNAPTFVLLNYTETMEQISTFAHEMGHAIHTDLSKSQPVLYQGYSTSTAEVASTLFESFVFDAVLETLSEEEKIAALHNRINDDVQTIFRQIACFNFETEMHKTIREKGGMSKEELGTLMNKHMSAYFGPIMHMKDIDGNFFVWWSHIRNFFYVYSYAFGQLVSKALYEKYKEDKTYLKKIDAFLHAGGSDSPENIFKSVGIDVTKPDFWEKGLKSIERDIERLDGLTGKK